MSNKTGFITSLTTGLLLVYTVMASLSFEFFVIFALFLIVSALTIVMVITILKDTSNLSGKKFDDYFYEDSPLRRIDKDKLLS